MNHKLVGLIIAALVATPCFAQSGSRSPVNSGNSFSPTLVEPARPVNIPTGVPSQMLGNPGIGNPSIGNPGIADPMVESLSMPAVSSGLSADSLGIPQNSLNDSMWSIHDPTSSFVIDHGLWDYFLSKYIRKDRVGLNRVAYAQVKRADRDLLRQYLHSLQGSDPRILNREEQLAFWLNLYNARTVSLVLEHYPLRSIRQIKTKFTDFLGPFDDPTVRVLGKRLSLNDIESGIIRPIWQDPRIHYALNCASYGCPNLRGQAWTSFTLDQDLNNAACQFINSGRAFKTGPLGRVIIASKIYKWYQDDFGGTDTAVLNHMRQYANASTRRTLAGRSKIAGYSYDWSLNDAKQNGPRLFEALRR